MEIELVKDTENWDDWRWQMKQKRIWSDPNKLKEVGLLTEGEKVGPISLTPYNVKLLMELKESDPEGFRAEWLQSFRKPIEERRHQWVWARRHDLTSARLAKMLLRSLQILFWGKGTETEVKGLENIYPKTDVILASTVCARNCAHCFREVGNPEGEASRLSGGMNEILGAVHKIIERGTPHVFVTGGDPLTRSNKQLHQILEPLVESKTVQVIRIGTRMPVDLPMRFFDKELLNMLAESSQKMAQKDGAIRVDVQINHPCELTTKAKKAIRNIQACGVPVICQTVVFRGVNDNIDTLRTLFMELDRLGVQSYKIFHSMPVPGTERLRIPLRKFRKLVAGLHQWLPGTAVPQANIVSLVGKIPVRPMGRFAVAVPFTRRVLVRGFRGELYLYKDAVDWFRWLREGFVGVLIAAVAFVIIGLLSKPVPPPANHLTQVAKIVRVADDIGYPDAWSRHSFLPFVQNNILYVPLQMKGN